MNNENVMVERTQKELKLGILAPGLESADAAISLDTENNTIDIEFAGKGDGFVFDQATLSINECIPVEKRYAVGGASAKVVDGILVITVPTAKHVKQLKAE